MHVRGKFFLLSTAEPFQLSKKKKRKKKNRQFIYSWELGGTTATQSISTVAVRGRPATATVVLC